MSMIIAGVLISLFFLHVIRKVVRESERQEDARVGEDLRIRKRLHKYKESTGKVDSVVNLKKGVVTTQLVEGEDKYPILRDLLVPEYRGRKIKNKNMSWGGLLS